MDPEIGDDQPAGETQGRTLTPSVRDNRILQGAIAVAVVGMLTLVMLLFHRPSSAKAAAGGGTTTPGAQTSNTPARDLLPVKGTATPSAGAVPSTPIAATTPAPAPVVPFDTAIAAIVSAQSGHGAVAVTDLTTGAQASYSDGGHLFDTGSIVKLDILATLLYRNQQAGTSMTSAERSYATAMIENSDNDAANSLFDIDGDVSGLTAANKVFGLTGTSVQMHWGDTTTDPAEQMKLLDQVFTSDSALTAASQSYIQSLMSQVEGDQRWGVSAAASAGTGYMLKNGWLPSSATGLWTINSIGEVTYDGHILLIAVQTDGNSDMAVGVSYAQQLAAAAASSIVANE